MILFNSWAYIIFLLIVVVIYWRLNLRLQNWLLLIASLYFYATWDLRFLSLIFLSTSVDYIAALRIADTEDPKVRKIWLIASISVNLLILGFFKYSGFFIDNLELLLKSLSIHTSKHVLEVILPIGISFYTFKAIGYVVEVYRGALLPTRSFLSYTVFVVFFPLLIAGPIERAKNLLPQVTSPRTFTWKNTFDGIDLIIWGLVKKVVVADNIAYYVTLIFGLKDASTLLILVGALAFGIQLLADFSAYTDIARGSSRILGFNIMRNFNMPYLAKNPSDFWSRWHISLSTYVRDYIYIPLGGDRCSKARYVFNIIVTWFLMGLWHGADWRFVLWGLYHGFLIAIHKLFLKGRTFLGWIDQRVRLAVSILTTYILVTLGWILFRTENIRNIPGYFDHIALVRSIQDKNVAYILFLFVIFYSIPFFLGWGWAILCSKTNECWHPSFRVVYYTICFLVLLIFGGISHDFVYFQF